MSEFIAILEGIHPILVCFLICVAKIMEVTISSLKTCMMVKGQKFKAACLGFSECVIWGLVVSGVISTLGDSPLRLLFYCSGYAVGLFLGSTIEGKIALGTSNLELFANDESTEKIIAYLKQNNLGYTVLPGHGATEKMNMIFVVLPRKRTKRALAEIRKCCDNKVFVVASEVSRFAGGHGLVK